MRSAAKNLILILPLIWFVYVWCHFIFGIDLGLIVDVADNPDNTPANSSGGIIPIGLALFMLFLGTPVSFLAGSIYTGYKKHWRWFGAYAILGGIPVCVYFFGVTGANLGIL
ncbi:hypothetical protein VA7868_02261 [Vibrio aerogenes CECT 7868]|uniref:Uncharacterized protein n=1 Tax=Vibrio aerogenes CECT 7868 TaxID=1216006 RepID=A0A1M5Z3T7_9VIBR|nr:hypothetical protein [Vibrio aerogenes]SHI18937.1 hypothetical protein VA7868_02261 [Vibrio aerogenes CECT 7868]